MAFDPAKPLKSEREEAYCQERAFGHGMIESSRRLGWNPKNGSASKYEAKPRVQARIGQLRRQDLTDEMVKAKRRRIEERLQTVAEFNLFDFIVRGEDGKVVFDELKPRIDWQKLSEMEYGLAVSSFRFDKDTGQLTDFRRDDRLAAEAQLRDMYGFSAPIRMELTGKNGGPMRTIEATMTVEQAAEAYASTLNPG